MTRVRCQGCGRFQTLTPEGNLPKHKSFKTRQECPMSGQTPHKKGGSR